MSGDQQPVMDGHEPQSNIPEGPTEVGVREGEEVTQEPFEGNGAEGTEAADLEATEDLADQQVDESAFRVLSDPDVVLDAPDTSGLRDIAEASFGQVGPPAEFGGQDDGSAPSPEVVLGTDDRVQISNTSSYPWRAHASLRITARDGSLWIGTGWFNGPTSLVTAGHVVFIYAPGAARHGWVRSIQVMPGRNGSSLPYGSVTSSNLRSVIGWTQSGDPDYDYGAIRLATPVGNTVGWFGFGAYSDGTLTSLTANISGYPGDKPSGTQWYHYRPVSSVNSRRVFYTVDTAGGQSGSAVYRITGGGRYAFAIHAYGGATANSGTRIVRPVFDNLLAWRS